MKRATVLLFQLATLLTLGIASACTSPSHPTTQQIPDSEPPKIAAQPKGTDIAPADGFDFPVGPPDGKRYYNAQGFGENLHLGDDWNGIGGGDTDMGDPVFAIASGKVKFAADNGAGWGNVVLIQHNIGTLTEPKFVESLYAHLDTMIAIPGQTVQRGQQIGTIGDAHGAYAAHLHFEIRDDTLLPIGGGYSEETAGYLDPTLFIQTHRKMRNEK
jgi:murein DD-endopeptidase MepM/ murein hydrolase activator NlpD